jgi:hypothetical protein
MSFLKDDLEKILLDDNGNLIEDIIQIAMKHADNVIVTRVGKLNKLLNSAIILVPHSIKKIEPNIIGKFDIIPINTIKEIIVLNYE